jgi:hypothetical protein
MLVTNAASAAPAGGGERGKERRGHDRGHGGRVPSGRPEPVSGGSGRPPGVRGAYPAPSSSRGRPRVPFAACQQPRRAVRPGPPRRGLALLALGLFQLWLWGTTEAVGPMHTAGRYEDRGGTLTWSSATCWSPSPGSSSCCSSRPCRPWSSRAGVALDVAGARHAARRDAVGGSANALNNHLDRDIDRQMAPHLGAADRHRRDRPRGALILGLVLGVARVRVADGVRQPAPRRAGDLRAILFYVFVYTLGAQAADLPGVVIGGIAGCMPVLTGWAAVSGARWPTPARGCCSRSCSGGSRRTSGRWR